MTCKYSAYHLFGVFLIAGSLEAAADSSSEGITFAKDDSAGLSQDGGVSRGVAWGDVNNDGFPDLVVANTEMGSLFLYLNQSGTSFERSTDDDIAEFRGNAQGVSFIDINNDGWLDLFVAVEEASNAPFVNDGSGRLQTSDAGALTAAESASTHACWADYDNDGWIDAYVVNADYQSDSLYRNRGGRFFEEVAGPWNDIDNHGRSCAWSDVDGDLLPDLYVANAFFERDGSTVYARNSFYRNRGELGFQSVLDGEMVNSHGYSYGVSWADFDQDGDDDLFVSNISRYEPNFLYENQGGGLFLTAWQTGVSRDVPGPVKGHVWADLDNDGDLDLFLSEGHGGARPEHKPFDNVNRLYRNENGVFLPTFVRNLTEDNFVSAGAAGSDIDRDGDIDLFIANWSGDNLNNEFYRNRSTGNWIQFELRGDASNRLGIGARLVLEFDEDGEAKTAFRTLRSSTGFGSANEPILHFGLGEFDGQIRVATVYWPSGRVDSHRSVEVNRRYVANEGNRLEPSTH